MTQAVSPVSTLDGIRVAARAAVDAPEQEWGEKLFELRRALDAYDATIKAMADALEREMEYHAFIGASGQDCEVCGVREDRAVHDRKTARKHGVRF